MKSFFIRIIVLIGRILGPIFFKKKYLQGKWFDLHDPLLGWQGWLWVLQGIWFQKILGFNRHISAPINPSTRLNSLENLHIHSDQLDNLQSPGCYFQNPEAHIKIDLGTIIGPNVCIITRNHNFDDFDSYDSSEPVEIGKKCWIGANSVILPGISIGDNVIIAAGSIVTKSFSGPCVIGGNPAKIIKEL